MCCPFLPLCLCAIAFDLEGGFFVCLFVSVCCTVSLTSSSFARVPLAALVVCYDSLLALDIPVHFILLISQLSHYNVTGEFLLAH